MNVKACNLKDAFVAQICCQISIFHKVSVSHKRNSCKISPPLRDQFLIRSQNWVKNKVENTCSYVNTWQLITTVSWMSFGNYKHRTGGNCSPGQTVWIWLIYVNVEKRKGFVSCNMLKNVALLVSVCPGSNVGARPGQFTLRARLVEAVARVFICTWAVYSRHWPKHGQCLAVRGKERSCDWIQRPQFLKW